jgi:uncharacterized protein
MDKQNLELYKQFARPHYLHKKPPHNFAHIERILAQMDFLTQGLPEPRRHRLYFLACFHGLDGRLQADGRFREAIRAFLRWLEWDEEEIEEIFTALQRHLKSPQSVEEKLVHDADSLERLGAWAIADSFTAGGTRGQTVEEILQLLSQSQQAQGVFQTPAGRHLAERRKRFMRTFLEELHAEISGEA